MENKVIGTCRRVILAPGRGRHHGLYSDDWTGRSDLCAPQRPQVRLRRLRLLSERASRGGTGDVGQGRGGQVHLPQVRHHGPDGCRFDAWKLRTPRG